MIRPSGPCPAKIMIVGEIPGDEEVRTGRPFEGSAGQELSRLLADAGIMRSLCFLTYVCRTKLSAGVEPIAFKRTQITADHVDYEGTMIHRSVREGITYLKQEIEMCRPNVIIAIGNLALWALTKEASIQKWRGSEMLCALPVYGNAIKVIPTYSPSMVLRVWSLRGIVLQDLKRVLRESLTPVLTVTDYKFTTRPDFNQCQHVLVAILNQLNATKQGEFLPISVDIETRRNYIACIGFAWTKFDAICIPIMCVESVSGYWEEQQEVRLVELMRQILTHPRIEIIGQNFLYDAQYLYRYWAILVSRTFDTMIAQHVCYPGMEKGLDFLSSMYCDHHLYWKDDGKEWREDMDEDKLWRYNCMDCVRTFEVSVVLKRIIKAYKLDQVNDFQQALAWPVLKTMLRGIRIDHSKKAKIAAELLSELNSRQLWVNDVVGEPLNIQSSDQMKTFVYGIMRQKPILNRKTKQPSCDDEALRKIGDREPLLKPILNKIAEMRSIKVFLSTFINSSADQDGKMRCSYNITGTDTYRFNSKKNVFGSGMNLQNIPSGDEEGQSLQLPNVRKLFIPDPGMEFFDIDLSSADLRIVVWESDEKDMKQMLAEGYDPYTVIAQEFYHDPTITKKDPRRQTFKGFAHGTNYLGTAKGLAERFGLSVHEAEKTQKWYFSRFPRIKAWQERLKDQVFKRKYISNVFGYRFNILDRVDQSTLNAAAAWIPQSTVACIINRAFLRIDQEEPEVEILLQVHDSLAGQYPADRAEHFRKVVVEKAAILLPYSDPLVIPVGIKTSTLSWGDCA